MTVIERWRITRRPSATSSGDDWHVAVGPDPGDDRDGIEVVRARAYEGAVTALQQIYDWCHMAGDGYAGKVSDEALRALGIDPDAAAQS